MQRLQRRLALLLSAALAVAITMLTVTPASAVDTPSRSNGSGNRVIFVHGFSPITGKVDCADYFRSARTHFKGEEWKGNLLTFGYYSGDTNCSYKYNGNRDKSIKTVARAFANYVYTNYSKKGIKVDVVAHSMGGLVVRAALHHTREGTSDFPPYLFIEDVATLGTPHGGTTSADACNLIWQQCVEMRPGSAFLKSFKSTMPNSRMGTDWTTVSSFDDKTTSEVSGIAGIAEHEVQYDAGISHTEIRTISSERHKSRIKHTARGSVWSSWDKRVSPVEQARLAVLSHSTT